MCDACGVPAYGGETFCVACGAYLGWEETGGRPLLRQPPARSGPALPAHDQTLRLSRTVPPVPYGTTHATGGTGEGTGRATAYGTDGHVQIHEGILLFLACPDCRSDNPGGRTYCRLCGALLRPEPGPVPLTRWQKLRKRWYDRPQQWHRDRRWLAVPLALPLCFAVGAFGGRLADAAREAVPAVQDRFSGQAAVAPDRVEASAQEPGFEAGMAVDGVSNRFWAPARKGAEAVGETWTATFERPFRLTALVIFNGASADPKAYLATGRPTRLTAIAETAGDDGRKTVHKEVTLADQPGAQDFRWGVDDVVSVTLRIAAVHAGAQPDGPVALAEVQFFTRQGR